jgi:ABC-2 type transport system permease protein
VIALLRTEMTKAVRRTRTYVVGLGLVALPVVIVFALNARGNGGGGPGRDHGEGLFRLADQSGLLVPAAVLSIMSGFLLVVIAATFAGDTVAGDAGWGNLRYLLMRPVPRGRLLLAKATVAGALIWASTLLVALAALVGGVIVFGSHAVVVPTAVGTGIGGFQLSTSTLLLRVLLGAAYVAFGYTALLALGTFFSTVTDSAAGAIGATVGVYIVSEILDAITQIGQIRYGFPTHYQGVWETMFTQNQFSSEMLVGIAVQLAYLVVFGTAALVLFRRKDIRS